LFKPVILLGNGIRYNPAMIRYLCMMHMPIITTWMAADLLPEEYPQFCGRGPGILGQRAANIIVQKADMLMCFGARLDPESVAYRYDNFAPRAEKIIIDVDMAEVKKFPDTWKGVQWDLTQRWPNDILAPLPDNGWLTWARELHERFRDEDMGQNAYRQVVDWLSDNTLLSDVFALGSSGIAPCMFYQWYKVLLDQRVHNVSTIGAMGADIPMAIGSAIGTGRRTICLTGDGGFMLNVHELEVVRREKLNIKFIVFSNGGYGSIRNMQKRRFAGNLIACDDTSGFTLPSLEKIAATYRIGYSRISPKGYGDTIDFAFDVSLDFPRIIEVQTDPDFMQYPRVDSTMNEKGEMEVDPMEDMTPKLPCDELKALMEWGNDD
jgi:acetolactate synthase I/II/III large subunit